MDLNTLLEKTLTGLGYELVELELANRGRMVRLFIDKPGGINIDDCTQVSNHVSRLLAVEMDFDYDRLEVSSPGMDRLVRKPEDFQRYAGKRVQVRLRGLLNGQRKVVGILQGLDAGVVGLDVDGTPLSIEWDRIDKVRLVPEF